MNGTIRKSGANPARSRHCKERAFLRSQELAGYGTIKIVTSDDNVVEQIPGIKSIEVSRIGFISAGGFKQKEDGFL